MALDTTALLSQYRAALLRRSNEQLDALLQGWFVRMIGNEEMDEDLDDLCLLLDYRVRSLSGATSYATYTAWWEVEGYLAPGEGIFICADVPSLHARLTNMPLKQFDLVMRLAYHAHMRAVQLEPLPRRRRFSRELI